MSSGNAIINHGTPIIWEPRLLHYFIDKTPLYSIIGLTHVEFKGHKTNLALATHTHRMQKFERCNDIFNNQSPQNKGTLITKDQRGKNQLYSIYNCLSYQLIDYITKANRLIVSYFFWIFFSGINIIFVSLIILIDYPWFNPPKQASVTFPPNNASTFLIEVNM